MTFIEHKISISPFLFSLFFALIEWIELNNQDSAFQPYRRCLGYFSPVLRKIIKSNLLRELKSANTTSRQPPSMRCSLRLFCLPHFPSFLHPSFLFFSVSPIRWDLLVPSYRLLEKIEKGKLGNESTRSNSAQVFHNKIHSTQTNLTSSSIFLLCRQPVMMRERLQTT